MSRSVTRVMPFSVLALGTFHDYVTEQYYVFVNSHNASLRLELS